MQKTVKWIVARAKERSTWLGIIAIATAAGASLEPAQKEAIIAAGVAIAGAISAFSSDASQPNVISEPQWKGDE